MLFENLIMMMLLDAVLPLILPLITPDKYEQAKWKYQILGAWILFHGSIKLPPEQERQLLLIGYFQLLGVLVNVLILVAGTKGLR